MRAIQGILKSLAQPHLGSIAVDDTLSILESFNTLLKASLTDSAKDKTVIGFKSIACYRTGLDVAPWAESEEDILTCLRTALKAYQETGTIRLAHKALNDHIVRMTLQVAGEHRKPGSFYFILILKYSFMHGQCNFTLV